MKQKVYHLLFAIVVLLGFSLNAMAQPWAYDFGTTTGTITTGVDTEFFSNTPADGGTYRVRVGSASGSIELANPGTSLGTDSEVQLNAATSASSNKFTVYGWTDPSAQAYVKFKFRTTSASTGNLAFQFGTGTTSLFTGNGGYTDYNNSITTLWLVYTAGDISAVNRREAGSNIEITGHGFVKDSDQEVEVFANNAATSTTYYKNSTVYTLDAQAWDLWVNGTKISPANGWVKSGTLAADNTIAGLGFFAESSAANSAWMYIDDLEYSNALPTGPLANHDVVFSVVGANGTLTATVDGVAITTPASVQEGKDIIFTASPAFGYQVKEWVFNTVVVADNTSNTYTLSNLAADANVTVEFEEIPTTLYAVTFSVVNGNGDLTATVDGGNITSPADVLEGKDVVFTAVPATGFQVKEWTLAGAVVAGNTTNTYTLTDIHAISNVTVEFEAIPTYTITFTVKNAADEDITNAVITFNSIANAAGDYVFANIAAGIYNYSVSAPNYIVANITDFSVTETATIDVVLDLIPATPVATLPINYSGTWKIGLPDGWTQTGLGNDYAGVAARFDSEGDNLMVNFDGTPYTLSYTIKANSSGDWSGVFDVEESADGIVWTTVKRYENTAELTGTVITETYNLLSTTRFVKWDYTTKVNGNIALDDVIITEPLANLDVVFSVVGANGTLTASVDGGDITSPASVQSGKDVVFTATPIVGYQVKEWILNTVIVDDNTSNTYTLSNIAANANVTVEFEEIPTTLYAVTFSVVNGNGDLTATVDGGNITSPADVLEGKDVVFTAVPATGFQVKEWTLAGAVVAGNTTNTYTLTDIHAISNVTVEFEAIPTYTITFTVKNAADEDITNAVITFNSIANTAGDYVFANIAAGIYNYSVVAPNYIAANITDFSVTETATIDVVLDLIPATPVATLPINYSGPWQTGLPDGWTQTGLSADYSAGAAKFDSSNDKLMVQFGEEPGLLKYSIKSFTSGTTSWDGTFDIMESSDGETWTSVANYTGLGDIDHTEFNEFTHNLLSTTRFVKWVYTNKVVGNVGIENVIITLPLQNVDVTFSVIGTNGTLTASVDGGDITSPASVLQGKDVVFTAVPAGGYQVKEWILNTVVVDGNTSNTYTLLNLDANANVTVEFEEIPTTLYAVTFAVVNGNGDLTATVDGGNITSPADVLIGKNVVFTAVPATGFQVKEWKFNSVVVDDNVSLAYTLTNLQADANVTVEFEAIPTYTITFTVKNSANEDITNAVITFNGVANAAGDYVFANIVAGTYNYSVSAPNYISANITGLIVTETATIDVVLQAATIATLPINYSGPWQTGLPDGWTQTGLSADYSAGAAKFDSSNDKLMVQFGEEPGLLKYSIKSFTSGTTSWDGTFDIMESSDGETWTSVANYTGLGDIDHTEFNEFTHNLLSTTRFVKWVYTNKVVGNVGIENVIITLPLQNVEVTFSVIGTNGTLTATVDGNEIISPAFVLQDKDVVFTATPENGYRVKEWTLNSLVVSGITTNEYTVTSIMAETDVKVEFEFDGTGIEKIKNMGINIYPNPSNGLFTIVSDGLYPMEVIDLQGRVIISRQLENGFNALDMLGYSDGIYIIRIINANQVSTVRISKTK